MSSFEVTPPAFIGTSGFMPIADIKIGTRHRKDMGDISGLIESIRSVGLLHPIVVLADGTLVAGERRLEACKRLGWTHVPVTVVDLAEIARGELAENRHRKDFSPSEWVAISDAVRAIEERQAKARQAMAGGSAPGKLPEAVSTGQTRDKVAAYAGTSGRTLDKARAIVAAAQAEPEKFGKLAEDMDRTGRVNGPYKRLKVIKQAIAIRAEPPPYPNKGPYRVIVADPPWPYVRQEDPSSRGVTPYPIMSIEQICAEAEKVRAIAHEDCILWLWTTNAHLTVHAGRVLDAWGFEHKTILTWFKESKGEPTDNEPRPVLKMGMGRWLRGATEHCIMAVRGKPTVTLTNETTALFAPVREHSRKPDEEFLPFVEKLCPAPRYAYLFSRSRPNERWDCHGDEAAASLTDAPPASPPPAAA